MSSTATRQDSAAPYMVSDQIRVFPSFKSVCEHFDGLREVIQAAKTHARETEAAETAVAKAALDALQSSKDDTLAVYMTLAGDNPRSVVWIKRPATSDEPNESGATISMLEITDELPFESASARLRGVFTGSQSLEDLWGQVLFHSSAVANIVHRLGQSTDRDGLVE
ncbi:hypothetical protein EHS25_007234 [Saitozyma podzolica]|uniref:Uncharacterized protein n=1 Tax=Saitozyma podzolica TaxID=1890683 RepID=A0A427XMI0_9TREE|nr:hypothetical protein EHS25_007234 [Saitozyma podzolica]